MLNVIIIGIIFIGLTIHRYLSPFWEQRQLPYPLGFITFANIFTLIYLVSFIWMFGAVAGIIISILCYLQIIYSTFLWILLLPWLLVTNNLINSTGTPQVNLFAYGGFSFIVIILFKNIQITQNTTNSYFDWIFSSNTRISICKVVNSKFVSKIKIC